ncbi:MAG TPA: hypothetical protein VK741_08180 [Acetobacteraceae bacterium]|jgi:hypothetical protein|nr:hypothetical protein [Acetobacteraceae bacterium]
MAGARHPAGGAGTPTPEPDVDDTIRLAPAPKKPPLLTSRRAWLAGAGILGTACLLRGVSSLVLSPRPPPVATASLPVPLAPTVAHPEARSLATPQAMEIRAATEQEILRNVATGLTVFRFAPDQRILVLDFASLHQQGMMLNRVAALIEKSGQPRNRVLTAAELAEAIRAGGDTPDTYYYGHDYSAASLRRFFMQVDKEQLPLDPEEATLRALLEQVDWFKPDVNGGLISIPAVGADANVTLSARGTILHHELSHGMFFGDPDYATFVHGFWEGALTADERGGVRQFLGSEGYDTAYEELMYNEMQAYLMFTRDPEFFMPEHVGMTSARLADLQGTFLRAMPTGWLQDALAATPVIIPASAPGR